MAPVGRSAHTDLESRPYVEARRLVVPAVALSSSLGSAFSSSSTSPPGFGATTGRTSSPGTDSKAAIDLLDERFPAQAGDTVTIVVHDDASVTSAGVLAVAEPLVGASVTCVVGVVAPWDPRGSGNSRATGRRVTTVRLDSTAPVFRSAWRQI
jgi:RND superfamily putative drug exporter